VVFATALTPAPAPREGEWRVKGEGARVAVGLAILAPRQSRWSVLLRLILALPLTLWVVLLALASAVGTVAAWFAALINGRVPVVLQGFLTDVLRYDAKISAYLGLLTQRWPGWSLRVRAGDQVSLEIDHVDLNRWSVLFRLVLAVPALVVSGVANVGGYLVSVVMWLCALALGRVPQPLHEARAQIWRFTIRASAFVGLLSPSQPFDDFFGQAATPAHEVDDATALSTRATLSSPGRAIFIVALLTGAYFQVQPGLVRWPLAYVVDRTMAPALVNAINRNIVDDLANYASNAATCTGTGLGACPVDAATAQIDVDRQRQLLHNFEQLMVQGRHEYFAYEHEVLVIELTLEQAANSPVSDQASYRAQVLREQSVLAALYEDVRRAL
jgi:hypothetical protein